MAQTQLAKKSLYSSARVISHGLACITGISTAGAGASHECTITGNGAAMAKLEQFRAVNTLRGKLNTSFSGTYRAFDFSKYVQLNLVEVQFRFNRRFDLSCRPVWIDTRAWQR